MRINMLAEWIAKSSWVIVVTEMAKRTGQGIADFGLRIAANDDEENNDHRAMLTSIWLG
jgi:hypothetical protein